MAVPSLLYNIKIIKKNIWLFTWGQTNLSKHARLRSDPAEHGVRSGFAPLVRHPSVLYTLTTSKLESILQTHINYDKFMVFKFKRL